MNIKYPLLLDGGLSNQLEAQGHNLNNKLWSARFLTSNPEAIVLAHLAYLNAGAKCITTSSYQASIPGFMDYGYDIETAKHLIVKSVELASDAIKQYLLSEPNEDRPLIAASIGPYGAYLADGSEYHGEYNISDLELTAFHLSRIRLLDETNADFFACETIPSYQEAKVLANILLKTKKTAWISFSCQDEDHLNDGTPISKCVSLFSNHPNVFAIGVNCTAPRYISGLIKNIKLYSATKKIIVYPNSGQVYNAQSKTWQGLSDPGMFVNMTKEWIDKGADIVGGCCRIGPEHIKVLKRTLFSQ